MGQPRRRRVRGWCGEGMREERGIRVGFAVAVGIRMELLAGGLSSGMSFALSLRDRRLIDGLTARSGVDDGAGADERRHSELARIHLPRYAESSRRTCKTDNSASSGYSIERYCLPHFKPHSNRTHRAFILGKYSMYLDNPELCAWSTDHKNGTFGYLPGQLDGLGFAGTFQDTGEMTDRGVENFGGLTVEGFYELLSNNKVLVSTRGSSPVPD
jgi:hypothetical protein